MFKTAITIRWRVLLLLAALGAALAVTAVGGLARAVLRCDMRDSLSRAAPSPYNRNEQYLYACGYLWRTDDGGATWFRGNASGLPWYARDGYIASDRQPGILYLGVIGASQSSVQCWNCAWTIMRPAIYLSTDGGRTWTFQYKFRRGPANNSGFIGLFTDPGESGSVWAVIKNEDEIGYYGSRTSGQNWSRVCQEYYFIGSGGCEFPLASVQQMLIP
jgi:hypothetical protein